MKAEYFFIFFFLIGIKSLNGFYIDGFEPNENSSIINALAIFYDDPNITNLFPKQFTINIKTLLNQNITFVQVAKNEQHPIGSDQIYTSDSNKRIKKFKSSEIDNEPFEMYKSTDNKSVATLIRNSNAQNYQFRILATINSQDFVYNLLPIVQKIRKRNVLQTGYNSELNSHAIVRRSIKDINFDNIISAVNTKVKRSLPNRSKRSNNGQPFNLFVEYLIVTDPTVYNDQMNYAGTTNQNLVFMYMKAYFAHYANIVNQRYQNSFSSDPDMRITVKLTNFLFLTSTNDSQWTNTSLVGVAGFPTYNGRQVILTTSTLNAFATYMNSLQLNFTYDHAVGLFNKDLWGSTDPATSSVAGFAPIGFICSNFRYSIAEEIGGFRYAVVSAHELGHNLGAHHDGANPTNGGDIYSQNCNQADYYLMTASLGISTNSPLNNQKLSSCSILSIKSIILGPGYTTVSSNAQCLTNVVGSQYDYLTQNILPGQFFTADDQCQMIYGSSSGQCQYASSAMCTSLFCRSPGMLSDCSTIGVGAAPGTTCASGKSCLNGVCTNSSTAPVSTCPFGDDTVVKEEIKNVLNNYYGGFLSLPLLPTMQMNCSAALSFFASSGFSPTGLCLDPSNYFKTTCCSTCQQYTSLTCADTLLNCPSFSSNGQCSGFLTIGTVTNQISKLCPYSCNACPASSTSILRCTNSQFLCQNGGTCQNTLTASANLIGFTCSCPVGYSGSLCQTMSPCLLNPCQNGGVCQQFGSLGYVCACVNGFSGYNCTLFNGVPVTTGSTSSTTATPMASTTQSTTSTVTTGSTPNSTVSGSTATLMTPTTSTSTTSATPTTSTSTTSKSTTSTTSATPTTQNSCSFNLCRNGASCIPTSMVTYSCSCLQGFSGTYCQLSSLNCQSNPCQNGATCTNSPVQFGIGYACKCPTGFSGINCQTDFICNPNPCLNGGTCVKNSPTTAYCLCAKGYSGLTCQIASFCASNPCKNGGSCLTVNNNQICACTGGYTGSTCDIIANACNTQPCLNNGTCKTTSVAPFYQCSCPSNYAGNICQTLITTTTSPSTPLNCVDSNPANCKLYAANNYCKPIYFVFGVTVLNYCPASCGLCVSSSHSSSTRASTTMSSTTCLDLYSACPTWKSMQWCNLFPVYNVCKKSCNLC